MIKTLFILNLRALGNNIMRFGKNKSGTGKVLLVAFFVISIIASFLSMFGALFHSILEPFYSAGIGWMYFSFLAIVIISLCVIGSIYTASAQLFNAKDNELLLSMPIKPSAILISRLLVVIVLEYAFSLLVALPAFAVWLKSGYTSTIGILFFIIGTLLLPLMAMVVSLLLAWLLGIVTSRLRNKNIITLALSIGFLIAYFYFAANLQGYLHELISNGKQLAEAFQQSMPPLYAFGMSITNDSIISGLIFMVWAILPFIVTLILLMSNYKKILITNRGNIKIEYKEKTSKAGNALTALLLKEMSHFWSKPFVILNSSLGSLFMCAVPVIVVIKKADILLYIRELTPLFSNLQPVALMAIAITFLNAANNISSALISLEGKNLWIIKSIPVSPLLIIKSKVYTHLLISGLPCLVASISIAMTFAITPEDWMIILLLPQSFGLMIAVGGVAINLHFPKFDWTNEIYVVKQGASSMISLFGAIGIVFALGFAYAFLFANLVSLTTFLWLCIVTFTGVAAAVYAWLAKSGTEIIVIKNSVRHA